jgi:hypothetical protein
MTPGGNRSGSGHRVAARGGTLGPGGRSGGWTIGSGGGRENHTFGSGNRKGTIGSNHRDVWTPALRRLLENWSTVIDWDNRDRLIAELQDA